MGHYHHEVIVELDELEFPELEDKLERAFDPLVTWDLGGSFRGAHEPGGPFPKGDDLVTTEVGGMILTYTRGKEGIDRINRSAMARASDLIWLNSVMAAEFLAREHPQVTWVQIRDDTPQEIDRASAQELSSRTGLALATIDVR